MNTIAIVNDLTAPVARFGDSLAPAIFTQVLSTVVTDSPLDRFLMKDLNQFLNGIETLLTDDEVRGKAPSPRTHQHRWKSRLESAVH